jgi:hypothetical protein
MSNHNDGVDWRFVLLYPCLPALIGGIVGWLVGGSQCAFAGVLLGIFLCGVLILGVGFIVYLIHDLIFERRREG